MAGPNMPPRPSRAGNILAWADALHDVVRSLLPFSGPGVLVNRQANGTSFSGNAGSGSTPPTTNPFDLTLTASDDSEVASFVPGAGQNLVPGNILEAVDVPAGMNSYAFLRLNTDGKSVQDCTLKIDATAPGSPAPVKNALPMQIDVLLHLINYTAATDDQPERYTPYRVFWPATSVWLKSVEVFRTSNTSAGPGELPYDIWYTWQPTNVEDDVDDR